MVNEYQHWPHALPPHRLNRTITSILAEPRGNHGRLLGVISLANGEPARPFTSHHRALLHLFADQAAIAIENARLYEAAQCEVAERHRMQETLTRYQLLADQARDIILFGATGEWPHLEGERRRRGGVRVYLRGVAPGAPHSGPPRPQTQPFVTASR